MRLPRERREDEDIRTTSYAPSRARTRTRPSGSAPRRVCDEEGYGPPTRRDPRDAGASGLDLPGAEPGGHGHAPCQQCPPRQGPWRSRWPTPRDGGATDPDPRARWPRPEGDPCPPRAVADPDRVPG